MPKIKKAKPTKVELHRKIRELEAQMASVYADSAARIDKALDLMGSGVVIQMTVLGGREVISPTLVRDGLSPETVAALKADFKRSYDLATLFAPKD